MSLCSDRLSSDQYFLVNFIMSKYLGPDVYSDDPRISASQRLAKRLPPYTSMHIGSSSLTVAQLQNLYYYVLRNAESSLLVHPDMLYTYLKGYLPLRGMFPQFTSFFPTNLHPQKKYSPSHEIVKGIVVIDDPAVAFISTEELKRFRCLSCLDDLKIDRVVSLSPLRVKLDESRGREQEVSQVTSSGAVINQDFNSSGEVRENCKRKNEEEAVASLAVYEATEGTAVDIQESQVTEQDCSRNGLAYIQDFYSSAEVQETCKRKKEEEEKEEEAVTGHDVSGITRTPERFRETYRRKRFKNSSAKAKNKNGETATGRDKKDQPKIQKLVPFPPGMKECEPEPAAVTRGTAREGAIGPSIGAVDIGVNKAAYFFRVALPGVCKDYGEFSCEIDTDGKVILEGLSTTGQKTIKRHSRVFEMKTRKLCPPGPFKLCFSLPGPVDPRLISPKFRSDGIFEAVIIRQKKNS
ncbi:unnamed protein product [Microthlaspi erraticum]|uniref:SHSP domain-containing protein n=1 Tax=Microthlaspi erraticum TaxID=1685480 RepID=A0A6D2HZL9_9BRAS|nr:unnamed protein product [Microthlaspi erraticum]